ncbi:oxidoreductase [Asaia sp. W19]|uniref:SDR family NAD(P)-dependent oxidoreductase n=1 Tax=unclassified Asaia TaxID=2685023 RepID=UPI000F8D2F09|nr:SDR family oxidoreductase [Asaia sp. W19]RUT24678.1 oxidoreductase [Asaia sp. W19]
MTSKVALVTGASRGIGAGIARQLAGEGYDIAFSYPHDAAGAQDTIRQVEALGRRALAVQADGSTTAGNEKIVAETIRVFGRLDVLVCNAGMYPKGTIDEITVDSIEAVLNLNVRGPMIETMCAIRHMKAGGRIVLMGSSFGGRAPLPGLSLYSGTKAALRGFAQGVARDLGSRGITINVVEPGPVNTAMNPSNTPAAAMLASHVATGAYGEIDDITNVVSFLVNERSSYITGSALAVDGGLLA